MSIIDRIAEEHSYLLKDANISEDMPGMFLSRMIDVPESNIEKIASFVPGRINQQADLEMHQNDETKDFWIAKQGKIVRIVSNIVKG